MEPTRQSVPCHYHGQRSVPGSGKPSGINAAVKEDDLTGPASVFRDITFLAAGRPVNAVVRSR